jgi:hypothetical protein
MPTYAILPLLHRIMSRNCSACWLCRPLDEAVGGRVDHRQVLTLHVLLHGIRGASDIAGVFKGLAAQTIPGSCVITAWAYT